MTVLPRILAAVGALALGLGGAVAVAAPAAAATFTVTKISDDGLPGSLTYAFANLVPGGNTITITASGTILIPGAIPDITEDVDIVGPVGGVTIENTDTIDHVVIDGATVTMTDLDFRPNLGGIDQGLDVIDSDLTLTRVSVEGFDYGITATESTLTATDVSLANNASVGLYSSDLLGTNPVTLTTVALGGSAGAHVSQGAVIFGSGARISLTNVTSAFTDVAGLVLGSDVGDIVLDGVTVEEAGIGISLGASGGSTTIANHVTINRTLAGLLVNALDDADLDIANMNIDETDGDGVDVTALNGSHVTIGSSSVTASSGSGFILDATDSTIELSDSTSSGNGLGGGCGCGGGSGVEVYADNSTVTLDGVTSSGNTATHGAGILSTQVTAASILTIRGSTVTGANSSTFGAGIYLSGVDAASTVSISGSTITGNVSSDDGGGIMIEGLADDGSSAMISDTEVSGNTSADYGGGIYLLNIGQGVTSTAKVTIARTTVDGNHGGGYGGGIAINEPAAETTGKPTVIIDGSTLSNNITPVGGAGLYVGKGSGSLAVITVINTTISGNDAQLGSAIQLEGPSLPRVRPGRPTPPFVPLITTIVSHSTIAGNSAHTSGGIAASPQSLELDNSIVSGSTSNNGSTPDDLDVSGTFIAHFTLVQTPKAGLVVPAASGNVTGVDPQLAPLANNGGITKTMLIAPGSPAYNAGDPAFAGAGLLDQRGQARVFERLDMGAVEWHPALAHTGQELTPGPPLVAFLLLFAGLAMVAFSRLQLARSIS